VNACAAVIVRRAGLGAGLAGLGSGRKGLAGLDWAVGLVEDCKGA
jgi:hypothetical protein